MPYRRAGTAALLALLWLAGAGQGTVLPRRPVQDPLESLVPADGAVPGWSKDGPPQLYAGEDLYAYIDGGAEIYQEYGFRRVVIQDYKSAEGRSVSLEIFEMASPEAAYGIYTFKRSGRGKSVRLGAGGDLEDYYLNFWEGRYLATLTGFDGSPGTLAGLQAVGAAVDARIADKSDPPALGQALPARGLKAGSVKYLRGPLGLNNVYSFYSALGLDFKEAVKGDYEDGSALIILDYGSAEARARSWAALKEYLEGSARFKPQDPTSRDEPVFLDGKGRSLAFAPSGPRLLIGLGDSAAAASARVR